MRTEIYIIVLLLILPIRVAGQQNQPVLVSGRLEISDRTGTMCSAVRDSVVISFLPDPRDSLSFDLSFPTRANPLDTGCRWSSQGTLHGREANLRILASLRDLVHYPPTGITIRRDTPGLAGIVLNLVDSISYRDAIEYRARAHDEWSQKGDLAEAIRLYDLSYESVPDPRTLAYKADALDHDERYAGAAETWSRVATESANTNTELASEAARRWVESLYRDAAAEDRGEQERWLRVAEGSRAALNIPLLNPQERDRIIAVWLDSLFEAAGAPNGDYAGLRDAILQDEDIRDSFDALYYGEFREGARPDSLSGGGIVAGIGELEVGLGRKAGAVSDRLPP